MAFSSADFFSIQDKDHSVLANDLLTRDEWLLRPGEERTIERVVNRATTSLGFTAAYRSLSSSTWRAVTPLPETPAQAWYHSPADIVLVVELGQNAIQVRAVSP